MGHQGPALRCGGDQSMTAGSGTFSLPNSRHCSDFPSVRHFLSCETGGSISITSDGIRPRLIDEKNGAHGHGEWSAQGHGHGKWWCWNPHLHSESCTLYLCLVPFQSLTPSPELSPRVNQRAVRRPSPSKPACFHKGTHLQPSKRLPGRRGDCED